MGSPPYLSSPDALLGGAYSYWHEGPTALWPRLLDGRGGPRLPRSVLRERLPVDAGDRFRVGDQTH